MGNIVKPGHTSLNMDDIDQNLSVVHHHVKKLDAPYRINNSMDKPVIETYRGQIQKADDTDLVGGIEANKIAVAVNSENRTTVDNAMNFNGHPWSEVMNKVEGDALATRTNGSILHYADDISDLRTELYELKHELKKQGLIQRTEEHMGYDDVFRNGFKPYEYEALGSPGADGPNNQTLILTADMTNHIDPGDYIAIYFKDVEKVNIRQVASIDGDRQTVHLDEAIDTALSTNANNILIYKSYGVSKDGNFFFAKDATNRVGDTVFYSGLDDDTTYTFRKPLNSSDNGYGYSFRIPDQKLGYLTKFDIQARSIGTPTLTCYILDEQDIRYFKNPVQFKKLYESKEVDSNQKLKAHFFAASNPIQLDPSLGQHIYSFDFWDSKLESYPELSRKDEPDNRVRYVAIIMGTFTDNKNYAEIYFLQNKKSDGTSGDLQTNNTTYYYSEQQDTSSISALTSDSTINASDMYYSVEIREKISNGLEPVARGLYTAKIDCNYPEGVSRARMSLRFAREGGIWHANVAKAGIYGGSSVNSSVTCECVPVGDVRSTSSMGIDNNIRKPLELREVGNSTDITMKPDLIVGKNIIKGSTSELLVYPNKPIYIEPDDIVYRNAYIISAKGKLVEYDPVTQTNITKGTKKVYLKPVAIIPDGNKADNDQYSDRLIFEGDFTDDKGSACFFNQIEFQIYWEQSNFNDNESVKQKQIGIIHDLVFSTDRTIK